MNDSLLIQGYGVITVKLALAEVAYYANLMQAAYKRGDMNMAISAMRTLQPFVESLKGKGYRMEQILPESK